MAVHVINEARRCLQCKKPLCRIKGCPVQTNVPEMIRLFLDGKINECLLLACLRPRCPV